MKEVGKYYHMSIDIEGFLRRNKDPSKWPTGIFKRDDGTPMHSVEAVHYMRALLARGVTGLPTTGCDHFDPMTGRCLGHETSEEPQEK